MNPAHVVQRHGLAKNLVQGSVCSQRQRIVLQRAREIPGFNICAAQIVEHGSSLFLVIQSSKKTERLLEIFDGPRVLPLSLVEIAQIVQGNSLLPGISRGFGLAKLCGKLLQGRFWVGQFGLPRVFRGWYRAFAENIPLESPFKQVES